MHSPTNEGKAALTCVQGMGRSVCPQRSGVPKRSRSRFSFPVGVASPGRLDPYLAAENDGMDRHRGASLATASRTRSLKSNRHGREPLRFGSLDCVIQVRHGQSLNPRGFKNRS